MNILEKVKEWFEGKDNATAPEPPKANVGQHQYHGQTADTETQAQVTNAQLNAIPVDVSGIVPVWKMPSKHQIVKQSQQGAIRPADFLDGDYKWARVTMWVTGVVAGQVATGVFVGTAADLAGGATGASIWGAQLPVDKVVVMEGVHTKLSFIQTAASIAANGALSINYIAERWAD